MTDRPWRAGQSVIAKAVGDETILLDLDRGIYYGLDEVGARIWQLITGGTSAEAVIERVTAEYDVTREEAANDIAQLLAELSDRGLLVR